MGSWPPAPHNLAPFSCWSGREEKKKRKKRREKRERKEEKKKEGGEGEGEEEREEKRKETKSEKDIKSAQNMFKSSVAQSKCCVFHEKK